MDKEILELLKAMQLDIQEIKSTQQNHTKILGNMTDEIVRLREDATVLKEDVTILKEDVAVLKDDMKEVKVDLRLVKIATVENSNEIEKLKVVK